LSKSCQKIAKVAKKVSKKFCHILECSGFNAACAGSIMIVHKSIMHKFVKFCILHFVKHSRIGTKIMWHSKGMPKHDYHETSKTKCNFKKLVFV
jgi:hypothetical protein